MCIRDAASLQMGPLSRSSLSHGHEFLGYTGTTVQEASKTAQRHTWPSSDVCLGLVEVCGVELVIEAHGLAVRRGDLLCLSFLRGGRQDLSSHTAHHGMSAGHGLPPRPQAWSATSPSTRGVLVVPRVTFNRASNAGLGARSPAPGVLPGMGKALKATETPWMWKDSNPRAASGPNDAASGQAGGNHSSEQASGSATARRASSASRKTRTDCISSAAYRLVLCIERDVAVMDAAANHAILPIEILDGPDDGKLLVDVQGPRSEGKARHGRPCAILALPQQLEPPKKPQKKSAGPRAVASGLQKAVPA